MPTGRSEFRICQASRHVSGGYIKVIKVFRERTLKKDMLTLRDASPSERPIEILATLPQEWMIIAINAYRGSVTDV
jgi:hypothetical protein